MNHNTKKLSTQVFIPFIRNFITANVFGLGFIGSVYIQKEAWNKVIG